MYHLVYFYKTGSFRIFRENDSFPLSLKRSARLLRLLACKYNFDIDTSLVIEPERLIFELFTHNRYTYLVDMISQIDFDSDFNFTVHFVSINAPRP